MTPEEEKVIAATQAFHGRQHCKFHMGACPLCIAVDALDASRAPKKPMSAFERACRWRELSSVTMTTADAHTLSTEIRCAESAAWDRAIDAASRAIGAGALTLLAFEALKGKCHEEHA